MNLKDACKGESDENEYTDSSKCDDICFHIIVTTNNSEHLNDVHPKRRTNSVRFLSHC